ncbi:MAG: STAS domain-containing protein [Chloroflexi bacterium]|nr:STAS domain-containing protein [Chloroflexota bacterium]
MDITCQALEANQLLVRLKGRLDAATSSEVKTTLKQQIEAGHLQIIVDLQDVPFIDSSGLAALVSGLRLAREKGGSIALSSIQAQAYIVFRLTMLDRVFAIYSSPEEAQQNLS